MPKPRRLSVGPHVARCCCGGGWSRSGALAARALAASSTWHPTASSTWHPTALSTWQVRTYVNGTLYSVLVRAALKERAHEIGLPDSLRALIEHSDETLARQINYILEQLESPPPDEKEARLITS